MIYLVAFHVTDFYLVKLPVGRPEMTSAYTHPTPHLVIQFNQLL